MAIIIHLVQFASQPDIRRSCDGKWDTVAWSTVGKPPLPGECYWADDGWAYTFEKSLATCKMCIATANESHSH